MAHGGTETLIVGGGAAGVAAAIAAAERGERVTVLERGRKPLKKLGVTGNGRCNLLNAGAPRYYGDSGFAQAVLSRVPYAELRAFFESVGVPLRDEDEGRVYPAALQAAVVVDALRLRAEQLDVRFATQTRATRLTHEQQSFHAEALQAEYDEAARKPKLLAEHSQVFFADRVIVTVGGAAAPAHGTDGSAYGLLTAFGHRLIEPKPALCALLTDKKRIAGLSGQRLRANVRLLSPRGEALHETSGELLFGDDAVSGIAAMQLARFVQDGARVAIDLRPSLTSDVLPLLQRLRALRHDRPLSDWLTGALAAPVAKGLLREARLDDPRMPVSRLRDAELQRFAELLACWELPVLGTRGFDQAQVTAGGVATDDFDPATLESRLCPKLYAAGEVLNVDGDCGGFNLMFAFATGLIAGGGSASKAR